MNFKLGQRGFRQCVLYYESIIIVTCEFWLTLELSNLDIWVLVGFEQNTMEGLALFIFVIALAVIIILVNKLTKKVDLLSKKLDELSGEIKTGIVAGRKIVPKLESGKIAGAVENKMTVDKKPSLKPIAEEPTKISDPKSKVKDPTKPKVVTQPSVAQKPVAVKKPNKPPKRSFMERNPDLEKFIGENLLSKIGIVIFVIGMGFLVKLGIDNEVITEGMRVAIGVLIGGAMVGLAHYLRKSFAKFSSILIGGALSVLYFTIALAFHDYELIPQSAAFVIMVLITIFGIILSIAYDRKSLAVLAIIGGFGTPFFISTGSGDFKVLFTYILILDIGMLVLVYFKKWNIINYLAYGFTYLLFAGVFVTKFIDNEEQIRLPLFLFLTAYYLIFFLMTIIYNVKNDRKFKVPEILMLVSNSGLYFGFGISIIHGFKGGLYSGIFTALTAIFNFAFAYTLYKRKGIDKNLLFLLIGLVLTFVSLIAPIQLKGNYITVFWALESVLLLWLSKKSGMKIMKSSAVIVIILMLISLIMDWQQNYAPRYEYVLLPVFINKVFITSVVSMISLFLIVRLLKENAEIQIFKLQFILKPVYLRVIFCLVVYLSILLELNYQFLRFEFQDTFRFILLGIYNYVFVIGILIVNHIRPTVLLNRVSFGLSILTVASYITLFLSLVIMSRDLEVMATGASTGYYWHYLLLLLFMLVAANLYYIISKEYSFTSKKGKIALYILSFIGVFVCSVEVGHSSILNQEKSGLSYYEAYEITAKSVYPVIWALSALALMVLGMKFRLKPLRIASLVLFGVTIVKLFVYDLAGNSTGKIVSFTLLGIILLLISFLYQKLKFIIQDDENKD